MSPGQTPPGAHGSVAEEIAALAEALRSRGRSEAGTGARAGGGRGAAGEEPDSARDDHAHPPGVGACEFCPVCRAIAARHTVSPAAVTSLADLARQAEITLRALAVDLPARSEGAPTPPREDIPVDDLGEADAGDADDE